MIIYYGFAWFQSDDGRTTSHEEFFIKSEKSFRYCFSRYNAMKREIEAMPGFQRWLVSGIEKLDDEFKSSKPVDVVLEIPS